MARIKQTQAIQKETTKVWYSNEFCHLECLQANYISYSFARHTHGRFAIGVIECGVKTFNYQGQQHKAGKGQIMLINPEEFHDENGQGKEGWAFKIFYVEPKIFHRAAMEIVGGNASMPFFKNAVVDDFESARKLLILHQILENATSKIERESLILTTFADLILRQSENMPNFEGNRQRATSCFACQKLS